MVQPSQGALQEGAGIVPVLVRQDLGQDQARRVIDAQMQELPAAACLGIGAGSVRSHPVPGLGEEAQRLISRWINSPCATRS